MSSSSGSASQSFELSNESASFQDRKKDIFSSISSPDFEKKLQDNKLSRSEEKVLWKEDPADKTFEDNRRKRDRSRRSPDRDSARGEFKRPRGPPPTGRWRGGGRGRFRERGPPRMPRLGNWKEYSLADVDEGSDRSNSRAAFDFLREKRDMKLEKERGEDDLPADGKITFSRPRPQKDPKLENESSGTFGDHSGGFRKVVMPKYVVGAAKPPAGRKKPTRIVTTEDDNDTGDGPSSSHIASDESGKDVATLRLQLPEVDSDDVVDEVQTASQQEEKVVKFKQTSKGKARRFRRQMTDSDSDG